MLPLRNIFYSGKTEVRWDRMGDGPDLVVIHGTPFSCQVWRKIVPLLAEHWRVWYYDMPGYGQSSKHDNEDISLGVQNEIFCQLLGEWGLNRPDILCHDFGGATALRAYFLNGMRYSSLTLFDAVAITPWGSPFVTHVKQHQAAFTGLPDYVHRALLRAYLQGAAFHRLRDEAFEVYMAPWLDQEGQSAFYRQIARMDERYTAEAQRLYGPMECPVNILWGECDEWIPPEQGMKLAKLLDAQSFTLIPEAGHLLQEDAPEAIVAAMLCLLAEKSRKS